MHQYLLKHILNKEHDQSLINDLIKLAYS